MNRISNDWVALHSQQEEDGVTVRPIRPGDAYLINEMHQRLSPDSIYYRYLQPRIPSIAEIEQVCRLAPEKGAGFVATVQRGAEIIVGVAYYMREALERHPTAEPGILVEDQFQGEGIGRSLWQRLQQHAKTNQIGWLRVLSHPNNVRVKRLVQGGGFAYQAKEDGDLTEYLVVLDESPYPTPLLRGMAEFGFSVLY